MEIYAATRPQDGHPGNEDGFAIGRGGLPYAALCDGSGNAQGVAKRALGIFQKLIGEASPEEVSRFQTWSNWTKLLDSSLLGGPQSTFLAIAVVGNRLVGSCAGDSRLYRWNLDGQVQILTEDAPKQRLGGGHVDPFPIGRGWGNTAPDDRRRLDTPWVACASATFRQGRQSTFLGATVGPPGRGGKERLCRRYDRGRHEGHALIVGLLEFSPHKMRKGDRLGGNRLLLSPWRFCP